MVSLAVRCGRWFALALIVAVACFVVISFIARRQPPDVRELSSIRSEWHKAGDHASSETKENLASRCLELNRRYPGTTSGLSALLLASTLAPDTGSGRQAGEKFASKLETADIDALAQLFDQTPVSFQAIEKLAPAILVRAKRTPEHARTARLLAAVCAATFPRDERDPPLIYAEAADLIVGHYADSPDIRHFPELLGSNGAPTWAPRYETHLRTILGANKDRYVRCAALFALAAAVQSTTEERQGEAETLYRQFCGEFDGKASYPFQQIEQIYNREAQIQIKELQFRAIGMPAPEITGVDLEDQPMTLSEHRGRVILLNFWGSWCYPCMKLVPHEKELVVRFEGQPFEIVGVDRDHLDFSKGREAAARAGMTWRSFRDSSENDQAISSKWKIVGYPTLYLIDHHGIIRKRWIGGPTPEELLQTTAVLVDAAVQKRSADAIREAMATLAKPVLPATIAPEPTAAVSKRIGTGFLEKDCRVPGSAGTKYALFIPHTYDGTKPFPAMLYLHGLERADRTLEYCSIMGLRGRSGRKTRTFRSL